MDGGRPQGSASTDRKRVSVVTRIFASEYTGKRPRKLYKKVGAEQNLERERFKRLRLFARWLPCTQIPPSLRVPIRDIVDQGDALLTCVLLGFSRDGTKLLSYTNQPTVASDGQGGWCLQIWDFRPGRRTRRLYNVPLFRSASESQLSSRADDSPGSASGQHLRLTIQESLMGDFLLVHGRTEISDAQASRPDWLGGERPQGVPRARAISAAGHWVRRGDAAVLRHPGALELHRAPGQCTALPAPHLLHHRTAPATCRAAGTSAAETRGQRPALELRGGEHGRRHAPAAHKGAAQRAAA